jgi:prepilin-type N-terminal cleavage/methylation domain-containing protein
MQKMRILLMSEKGFTLVELLVSSLLFSIICGIVFLVFNTANSAGFANFDFIDLQQQARQAIDGMSIEIRQNPAANPINITDGCSKITFTDAGDSISYYLNGSQIIREYPLNTTIVIANNISSLCFTSSGTTVLISLNATKNTRGRSQTFSLQEKVMMRN